MLLGKLFSWFNWFNYLYSFIILLTYLNGIPGVSTAHRLKTGNILWTLVTSH